MYNEALARAVLAERARDRESALHSSGMLDRDRRRGIADGLLARLFRRRRWSGPRTDTAAPALIVAIEMGDGPSSPPTELRASPW